MQLKSVEFLGIFADSRAKSRDGLHSCRLHSPSARQVKPGGCNSNSLPGDSRFLRQLGVSKVETLAVSVGAAEDLRTSVLNCRLHAGKRWQRAPSATGGASSGTRLNVWRLDKFSRRHYFAGRAGSGSFLNGRRRLPIARSHANMHPRLMIIQTIQRAWYFGTLGETICRIASLPVSAR